jgi:hypothetical protein
MILTIRLDRTIAFRPDAPRRAFARIAVRGRRARAALGARSLGIVKTRRFDALPPPAPSANSPVL